MASCHVDFMGAGGLAQRLSILVKKPAITSARPNNAMLMPQPMEDLANDKRVTTTISLLLCGDGPMSCRIHGSWRTGPTPINIGQKASDHQCPTKQCHANATAYGGIGQ